MILTFLILGLFLIALFIDFVILKVQNDIYNDVILSWAFGLFLMITVIMIPVSVYSSKVSVQEFNIRKTTIVTQRNLSISEFERVHMSQEILDDNAWLITVQTHKKNNFVNWFVSKDVLELTPIE